MKREILRKILKRCNARNVSTERAFSTTVKGKTKTTPTQLVSLKATERRSWKSCFPRKQAFRQRKWPESGRVKDVELAAIIHYYLLNTFLVKQAVR